MWYVWMGTEWEVTVNLQGIARTARNPWQLRQWAKNSDPLVRRAVAANLATPNDVLIELLSDRDTQVGHAAANNPHCPRWLRALRQFAD
jgi:hypothetical protein